MLILWIPVWIAYLLSCVLQCCACRGGVLLGPGGLLLLLQKTRATCQPWPVRWLTESDLCLFGRNTVPLPVRPMTGCVHCHLGLIAQWVTHTQSWLKKHQAESHGNLRESWRVSRHWTVQVRYSSPSIRPSLLSISVYRPDWATVTSPNLTSSLVFKVSSWRL